MALDLQESYLEHVMADMDATDPDSGFVVDDDSKADWALRKIAQAKRNIERRKEFVEREIERLRQWQAAEDKRDQQTVDFFTSALRPFFDKLRESGALGKRKSYRLPHGTLQVRASGPKWRREDNDALLKWAEERGLVRYKAEVAWSEIGKRLRPQSDHAGSRAVYVDPDSGEVTEVPGVVLESPAGETFSAIPEVDE